MTMRSAHHGRGTARPAGIDGYPGPFPVGRYAAGLRERLRRVRPMSACSARQVASASAAAQRLLRAARRRDGGLPCAMWPTTSSAPASPSRTSAMGWRWWSAGGCDYYNRRSHRLAAFTFRVKQLRLPARGDLLARLERPAPATGRGGPVSSARSCSPARRCRGASAWSPPRPAPRDATSSRASSGAAGAERSSGATRTVQDRRAAGAHRHGHPGPRRGRPGRDDRGHPCGGGSIADLWAFCATRRSAHGGPAPGAGDQRGGPPRGSHAPSTMSRPSAVPRPRTPPRLRWGVDCAAARTALLSAATRIDKRWPSPPCSTVPGRSSRSHALRASAWPAHRTHLHQKAREMRAASRRGLALRLDHQRRMACAGPGSQA